MLKDKDRIFKNLYNDLGPDLTSAKKRGDWINTKDLFEKDILYHNEIIANAEKISRCFNYERIATPIIESTRLS